MTVSRENMNFLQPYFTNNDEQNIIISAEQGSDFAKKVANDFNPIHNVDSKRFCVPGDLLFAIALDQYGLHQSMNFAFQGLVKADTVLSYPVKPEKASSAELQVLNARDKAVLTIKASGAETNDADKVEQLIRSYVAFSGHNFPHILVPLMKQHKVMINPERPLVIYESMALELDSLDFDDLHIDLQDTTLVVDGKRGTAKLSFILSDQNRSIGAGIKTLVLSGLREYQQQAIDDMCAEYLAYSQS